MADFLLSPPVRRLAGSGGLALALAICVAGCDRQRAATGAGDSHARPVSLIVSGDTAGWIVPCGCASNQSGGLLRRGSLVAAERKKHDIVLVDAGGAPGGTSPYERLKFEAILRGELAMGLVAHNLGGPEIALGADELRRLGHELEVPFLSANARDSQGKLIAAPSRLVTAGGQRIALVGVLSPRYASPDVRIDDPREAILGTSAEIEGQYDWLVVLAYSPEEELRELAASLPEAAAVVGGPTGQSIAPARIGPTVLASATNKGKFVVQLEPHRDAWAGRVVELTGDFADDAAQQANLQAYYRELARRDFTPNETGLVALLPPNLPSGYQIAGSDACRECHREDHDQWTGSKHAHAWETLRARGAHVDAYCQQCHTTGYGLPGGFESAGRSPERVNVGCESCHGPSHEHARDPRGHRTLFAARDLCVTCHDRENSPEFQYEPYWQRIVHGVPASAERSGL